MLVPTGVAHSAPAKPNIVFIITDDQRWDQLSHMPIVQRELVHKGTRFIDAFVTDALCCPSRISMLRGQYDHSTGVYNNDGTYGGWKRIHSLGLENSTLATWLDGAGYRTAMVGKYFNGYNNLTYVPPGWDVWRARKGPNYYNYDVSENGVAKPYGSAPADYDADVMTNYANSFIRSTPVAQPLFLWLAYHEPHAPWTVAPRYVGDPRCSAETNTDAPAFNENTADKPAYLAAMPPFTAVQARTFGTTNWVHSCESLLAVDSGVGTVVSALQATGRLDNTLIVLVSDSGLLYGEHRIESSKAVPYEEAIRTPLIMRYDPLTEGATTTDNHLVLNIDLAPTVADLVGLTVTPGCPSTPWKGVCHPGFDGRSLLSLVGGQPAPFARSAFLIEHFETVGDDKIPTYCATRTRQYIYVRYFDAAEELYDLQADPFEMTNLLHNNHDPAVEAVRKQMLARLKQLCTPTPPGYSFAG
jgi:N-acetylglucosamine-6-sulfatase